MITQPQTVFVNAAQLAAIHEHFVDSDPCSLVITMDDPLLGGETAAHLFVRDLLNPDDRLHLDRQGNVVS